MGWRKPRESSTMTSQVLGRKAKELDVTERPREDRLQREGQQTKNHGKGETDPH